MKEIEIQYPVRPLMLKYFSEQTPSVSHVDEIITKEAYLHVRGEVIAIYKKADTDLSEIRNVCINLKFTTYIRQSGIVTQTENINASPRNGLRTNKCTFTKFRRKQPREHEIFIQYARKIAKSYQKNFRHAYVGQIKRSYIGRSRVHEAYRIKGTPFTSGVINKNTALPYHRDIANTENGISCMLILKKGVAGGELILPELNVGFACQDGYILLFDGQKYIHGVTPILQPQTGKGHRYTIVYYNNKGMSLCLPPEEEERFYRNHLENLTEARHKRSIQNERL